MGRFYSVLWDWGTNGDGTLRPFRICASIPLLIRKSFMSFKWRTMS